MSQTLLELTTPAGQLKQCFDNPGLYAGKFVGDPYQVTSMCDGQQAYVGGLEYTGVWCMYTPFRVVRAILLYRSKLDRCTIF